MRKLFVVLLLTGCTNGTFNFSNDILGARKTDRNYTQGTKLSYDLEEEKVKESYSIGQLIYTPANKRPDADPALLAKDRPYAGYLFGEYRHSEQIDPIVQNTWGVQLGCIGNCALAKETQQGFHKLIGQGEPDWTPNNRLHNEPVFMLQLEQRRKQFEYLLNEYLGFDASLYGAGKLGTVVDSAAIGGEVRLGSNLPDFMQDEIVYREPFKLTQRNPWSAFVFARAEERYVAYNHLLQGSLFKNESHTVDSRDFVEEGQLGVSFGYEKMKLGYIWTVVSDEWTTAPSSFAFGSLQFSW